MSFSVRDYDYKCSSDALLCRIASPFKSNIKGSYTTFQINNLCNTALNVIQNTKQRCSISESLYLKRVYFYHGFVFENPYIEFIAKQIVNPLVLGKVCERVFNISCPFHESFLDTFLNTIKRLKFVPEEKIQSRDSFAVDLTVNLPSSPHAMMLEVSKLVNGLVKIKLFNTGIGVWNHSTTFENQTAAICYELSTRELYNPKRKAAIRDLMQFLRYQDFEGKNDLLVISEFYDLLDVAFGVVRYKRNCLVNKMKDSFFYNNQLGQDCAAKSVSVWCHTKFKHGVCLNQVKKSDYYHFKMISLKKDKMRFIFNAINFEGLTIEVFNKEHRSFYDQYKKARVKGQESEAIEIRNKYIVNTSDAETIRNALLNHMNRKIRCCQRKAKSVR